MNKEELAARLNGREYGNEITPDEERRAAGNGLVVLFGASDDLAEFRGAIHDEADCYDGGAVHIVDGKVYKLGVCDCPHAVKADEAARARGDKIQAVWCGPEDYSWTYVTAIQHATFDVMEGGERYCRGIVFELAEARS
jgi:hypothetical protein